jgi:hypothetical protein
VNKFDPLLGSRISLIQDLSSHHIHPISVDPSGDKIMRMNHQTWARILLPELLACRRGCRLAGAVAPPGPHVEDIHDKIFFWRPRGLLKRLRSAVGVEVAAVGRRGYQAGGQQTR